MDLPLADKVPGEQADQRLGDLIEFVVLVAGEAVAVALENDFAIPDDDEAANVEFLTRIHFESLTSWSEMIPAS